MARILIIDDEADVRKVLRFILERAGHQVEEAGNGKEGVCKYHEGSFDLIVTDIQMPEKDGFELIRELREDFPDVKIIAITARGLHLLPVAFDLGAKRVIEKPFSLKEVLKIVADLLDEG